MWHIHCHHQVDQQILGAAHEEVFITSISKFLKPISASDLALIEEESESRFILDFSETGARVAIHTAAYWKESRTLEEHLAKKATREKEMHILEITARLENLRRKKQR
jgi:hypothetical protein